MKNSISGVLSILKIVIKYGAIVGVVVKVVQFAYDEFNALDFDKSEKKQIADESDN
jgi:hypothetical protein